MSEPTPPVSQGPSRFEGGRRVARGLGFVLRVWLARLRFIAIVALVGLVIIEWETINAYWEKWTRPAAAKAATASDTEYYCPMHPQIIREHPDKCPICGMPLSARKKGEKDEEEPIPPGVIRRVQLSPYRVALAGLQTWEVGYLPLTKVIRTVGSVEFDERKLARISDQIKGQSRIDKLYVNYTGQMVEKGEPLALLYSPELMETVQELRDARAEGNKEHERLSRERLRLFGIDADQIDHDLHTDPAKGLTHFVVRSPIHGHVIRRYPIVGQYVKEGDPLYDMADLSTVWIEGQVYEDDVAFLKDAAARHLPVEATIKTYPGRVFQGTVAFVHPHLDTSSRTLRVRFDLPNPGHELRPGMWGTVRLEVPTAKLELFARANREDWQLATAADGLAHAVAAPQAPAPGAGLTPLLQAAVQSLLLKNQLVLAVPESAIIDTGSYQFVYREAAPGLYYCVEVRLGPRSGGFYPVVAGLEPGDKIVTYGSFLLDADTKLNPGVGSTYFGASGGPATQHKGEAAPTPQPSTTADEDAKVLAGLSKLSRADRTLAKAQKKCPIMGTRLGVMGRPVKLLVQGEPVFLCCTACVKGARARPADTLGTVHQLKATVQAGPSP
jgi:Cu(I)/Ag(I) efflux system membrane fusion protein